MASEFFLALLIASLIMVVGVFVGIAITMPFHGAVIRLRANYNPKGVGLEEGQEARVGPTLTSLWGTLTRTKRIEGWRGLYKGAVPSIIFTVLLSLASVIFIGSSASRGPKGVYTVPDASGLRMGLFTIALTLITLPMTIIINRCIITPYLLPYNIKTTLRLILTPDEYARPWTLYLAPGLLISTTIHALYVMVVARGMRWLLVNPEGQGAFSTFTFIIFLLFQLLSAFILTPLEVLSTRLSIQRNSYSPYSLASQSAATVLPDGIEYAGTNEDVVGLRPEEEPYEGFVDAAKKIYHEEGRGALWRAWYITALGNLAGAFS